MSNNYIKQSDAEAEARMRNEYAAKFGMINILTPEDKAKYSTFAQKVHNMNHKDVFKLYMGIADELTTEQKDIVAYEIKIREIESLKARGIDPKKAFSVENSQKLFQEREEKEYFRENGNDDKLNKMEQQGTIMQNYRLNERQRISEMTDDILRQSKKIADENPKVIKRDKLHEKNGGGINVAAKKYIFEDENGEQILINNEHLQNHFRKMYIKRLSEVTGIDYTKYDEEFGLDLSTDSEDLASKIDGDPDNGWGKSFENSSPTQSEPNYSNMEIQIDETTYEDD